MNCYEKIVDFATQGIDIVIINTFKAMKMLHMITQTRALFFCFERSLNIEI